MLNLLYEVIGLVAATATIIITLMSHIDNKITSTNKETKQELKAEIDSLRKEIKDENKTIRDYIFAYMSDRVKK